MYKENRGKNEERYMTLKQKAFIAAYTDKSKPTYSNSTKSVLQAYNTKDISTASSIGSENLTKPEIKSEVGRVLDKLNAGIEHRIAVLWDIGQGRTERTTKKYAVKGKKAKLVEVIKAEPTKQECIKAIEVISRLGGDYEKVKIARTLAIDKYRALRKQILKDKKVKGGESLSQAHKDQAQKPDAKSQAHKSLRQEQTQRAETE